MTALVDAAAICRLIAVSPFHAAVLQTVRRLDLPDWWIGAGFVRNAVWDRLHGIAPWTPFNDIDVIWFDAGRRQADACATDAMRYWPETATAVAVTMTPGGVVELAAPFGSGDLLAGIVRPTPHFRRQRMEAYRSRQRQKNWGKTWPELRFIED